MELNHFLEFLDIQLDACEQSIFCNEDIVGDVMSGLKTFVVKFMIRMSKVWELCVCVLSMCLCLCNHDLLHTGFCHLITER